MEIQAEAVGVEPTLTTIALGTSGYHLQISRDDPPGYRGLIDDATTLAGAQRHKDF